MNAKDRLHGEWSDAVSAAYKAGLAAVDACRPTPMLVGTPRNMAASLMGGDDGGFDPNEPVWYVADGACGFAWVNVKGDRKFLNWLKGSASSTFPAADALGSAMHDPRTDSYYGGVSIWVGGFDQSVAKKEAFANAFASKLRELVNGITVYGMSRLD